MRVNGQLKQSASVKKRSLTQKEPSYGEQKKTRQIISVGNEGKDEDFLNIATGKNQSKKEGRDQRRKKWRNLGRCGSQCADARKNNRRVRDGSRDLSDWPLIAITAAEGKGKAMGLIRRFCT